MLRQFLYKQVIDILLLQEVTHPGLEQTLGSKGHYNFGSEQRGTAIIKRENIEIHNILNP